MWKIAPTCGSRSVISLTADASVRDFLTVVHQFYVLVYLFCHALWVQFPNTRGKENSVNIASKTPSSLGAILWPFLVIFDLHVTNLHVAPQIFHKKEATKAEAGAALRLAS